MVIVGNNPVKNGIMPTIKRIVIWNIWGLHYRVGSSAAWPEGLPAEPALLLPLARSTLFIHRFETTIVSEIFIKKNFFLILVSPIIIKLFPYKAT